MDRLNERPLPLTAGLPNLDLKKGALQVIFKRTEGISNATLGGQADSHRGDHSSSGPTHILHQASYESHPGPESSHGSAACPTQYLGQLSTPRSSANHPTSISNQRRDDDNLSHVLTVQLADNQNNVESMVIKAMDGINFQNTERATIQDLRLATHGADLTVGAGVRATVVDLKSHPGNVNAEEGNFESCSAKTHSSVIRAPWATVGSTAKSHNGNIHFDLRGLRWNIHSGNHVIYPLFHVPHRID